MRLTLVLILSLIVHAVPARAQSGKSSGLRDVLVRLEDTGNDVRGQLVEIGPEKLILLTNGQRVEVMLGRVTRIRTARDSVKNGAIIGALIGGGWCALVCGQGLSREQYLPVVLFNAGFFSAIGVAIDAANTGQVTIYDKRKAASAAPPSLSFSFRF